MTEIEGREGVGTVRNINQFIIKAAVKSLSRRMLSICLGKHIKRKKRKQEMQNPWPGSATGEPEAEPLGSRWRPGNDGTYPGFLPSLTPENSENMVGSRRANQSWGQIKVNWKHSLLQVSTWCISLTFGGLSGAAYPPCLFRLQNLRVWSLLLSLSCLFAISKGLCRLSPPQIFLIFFPSFKERFESQRFSRSEYLLQLLPSLAFHLKAFIMQLTAIHTH